MPFENVPSPQLYVANCDDFEILPSKSVDGSIPTDRTDHGVPGRLHGPLAMCAKLMFAGFRQEKTPDTTTTYPSGRVPIESSVFVRSGALDRWVCQKKNSYQKPLRHGAAMERRILVAVLIK